MSRVSLGLVLITGMVMIAAASASGSFLQRTELAGRRSGGIDYCQPAQAQLAVKRIQNAFTGGAYPVTLKLRNVSRSECSIEGHPLVVVTPRRVPVFVGDLADFDRNIPYIGPERVVHLQPGRSAFAYVVIRPRCGIVKNGMVSSTATFAFYGRTASLSVQACRREGVEVDTGPFLPS